MNLKQKIRVNSIVFIGVLFLTVFLLYPIVDKLTTASTSLAQREIPILDKAHQLRLAVVQVQQYLTDISATRGLDGLNDGFDAAKENAEKFRALIKELQTIDPDKKEEYRAMLPAFENYYRVGKQMAEAYVKEGPAGGNKMMEQFDKAAEDLSGKVEPFVKNSQGRAMNRLEQQKHSVGFMNSTLVVSATIFIVMMLGTLFVMRSIISAINRVHSELDSISNGCIGGDLVVVERKDELRGLADSANSMKINLCKLIIKIYETVEMVQKSIERMADIVNTTNGNMTKQQAEIEQVASAINEMTSIVDEISNAANETATAVNTVSTEARQEEQELTDCIQTVAMTSDEMEQNADVIDTLQQQSKDISSILEVIRGIAEQTNLLALNAAIEAARAGEHGRGFAVVADEVRTLANRSSTATDEIHGMIEKLQSATERASRVMTDSKELTQKSYEKLHGIGLKIKNMTNEIDVINEKNQHVARSVSQEMIAVDEINRSISAVSGMANETVSVTGNLNNASDQLNHLAGDLQNIINKFKFH